MDNPHLTSGGGEFWVYWIGKISHANAESKILSY